jgi:hypothetical protein
MIVGAQVGNSASSLAGSLVGSLPLTTESWAFTPDLLLEKLFSKGFCRTSGG